MADSQRLSVRKNIQAALQAMTINGGYHWDVRADSVVRDPVALDFVSTTETPFFVLGQLEPMKNTGARAFLPALQLEDELLMNIFVRVDAPGSNPNRKDDAAEHMLADIEKALTVDITRGGYAIDTRLHQPPAAVIGLPTEDRMILTQPVEIRVQRSYGQP